MNEAEFLCRVADADVAAWFSAAGMDALGQEFVSLLGEASAGVSGREDRLFAIAAEIARLLPTAKGRTPRFETSLHAAFLQVSDELGGRHGYTYSDLIADYTDAATTATRVELSDPRFNPTAARQALKRCLSRANQSTEP